MLRINLLVHVHTVGLNRDLIVWREALRHPGIQLTVTAFHDTLHHRSRRIVRRLIPMLTRRPLYDISTKLVGHDRGVLVRYHRTAPQGAGTNFYVDPSDLEDKVNTILGMDPSRRRELGDNARDWYLENDLAFKTRLFEVMQSIA